MVIVGDRYIFERLEDTGFIESETAKRWRRIHLGMLGAFFGIGFVGLGIVAYRSFSSLPNHDAPVDQLLAARAMIDSFLASGFCFYLMFLGLIFGVAYLWGLLPFQRQQKEAINYAKMLKTLELAKNNQLIAKVLNDPDFKKSSRFLIETSQKWVITPKEVEQRDDPSTWRKVDPTTIFDTTHPRYRPELACAARVWLSFEICPKPDGRTVKEEIKTRIGDVLYEVFPDNQDGGFDTSATERIAVMINWDKNGNKFQKK